jgi:hypothetical protein
MLIFKINNICVRPDQVDFQTILGEAHGRAERPLCLCRPQGVPVYIAQLEKQFIVKRMPGSGFDHHPECGSYQPPASVSGLGEVMDAVDEDLETGQTTLRLAFQLSHSSGKARPPVAGKEKASVVADRPRLTLRGFLHYLWEEGGLSRWNGTAGTVPRSWFAVRKSLLEAADRKDAKSRSLTSMLYIPETFIIEKKDEIAARRRALFASIASTGTTKKLLLAIGELKDYTDSRFGTKVVLKHLPDCFFFCNEDLGKKIEKRFGSLLQWRMADDRIRVMTVMTFGIGLSGVAQVEEISFMAVDSHWLPVESLIDLELTDDLIRADRRFRKCLRYNLRGSVPLATALLTDCQPKPVAMHLVSGDADDAYLTQLTSLLRKDEVPSWIWNEGAARPALPALFGFIGMQLERTDGAADGPPLGEQSAEGDRGLDELGIEPGGDDEDG